MSDKKEKKISLNNGSTKKDEFEELNKFIKKKKYQNKALKKIIEKLDTSGSNKTSKQ